jgi:hypothetical protein
VQQPWLELNQLIAAAFGVQVGQGRPLLTIPADVLPLVFANRAALGRLGGRSVLDPTGTANERGHGFTFA